MLSILYKTIRCHPSWPPFSLLPSISPLSRAFHSSIEHLQAARPDDGEYRPRKLSEDPRHVARRHRYATDPEYRQRTQESRKKFKKTSRGIEYEMKLVREKPADHRRYYNGNPVAKRRTRFYNAIDRYGTKLNWTWKTHHLIRYEDQTEHWCSTCNRPRNLKLWWRRKSEPPLYDCRHCFVADWSRCIPEQASAKQFSPFNNPEKYGDPSS